MFTSRSRVRGRRGFRRLGWNRLGLQGLERRVAPAQLVVTSAADDGSAGTLRSIVAIANTNKQADTITFDPLVTSIQLVSGQITISENQNLTIKGGGTVTISGAAAASTTNRLFNITGSGIPTIEFAQISLTKGNLSSGSGGAIATSGQHLRLIDCTVTLNNAYYGGAVNCSHSYGGSLIIKGCQFSNNVASGSGGAVYYYSNSANGSVIISSSAFSNNASSDSGGALLFYGVSSGKVDALIQNSQFLTNVASGNGGAIFYDAQSSLQVLSSTFESNDGGLGGGIHADRDSEVEITNCLFAKNTALNDGGGINQVGPGRLNISNCIFSQNNSSYGGGVSVDGFHGLIDATATDSTWSENKVTGIGGGLYIRGSATVALTGCTLSKNSAAQGGAISTYTFFNPAALTLANCTVANNDAYNGGGIYADGRSNHGTNLTIRNCTIARNRAANAGGGLYLDPDSSTYRIDSSIVAANTATVVTDVYANPTKATISGDNNIFGQIGTSITLSGSNNTTNELSPGLMALGSFGGLTQTMPLSYNSPAIDKGSNVFGLTTDQRGLPRESPVGFPDVGAVEGVVLAPFVSYVSGVANVTKAGGTGINLTVVYDAPTGIDPTTIDSNDLIVTGRLPIQSISVLGVVTSGKQVTATYVIIAPGGSWDGTDTGSYSVGLAPNQVFDFGSPTVSIIGQHFSSFQVSIIGNLIVDSVGDDVDGDYSSGKFTLREAIEIANVDSSTRDTITFDSSVFGSQQQIALSGELSIATQVVINGPGANVVTLSGQNAHRIMNVTSYGSTLSGLTLANGFAADDGGAIKANQALTITNCQFVNNSATRDGGAIFTSASLTLNGCTLADNSAGHDGGAIHFNKYSNSLTITESTLHNNVAGRNGGAIFMNYDSAVLNRTTFSNNDALNGGAIYLTTWSSSGGPPINNCTFSGNSAVQFGGAVFLPNTTYARTLRNCTLTNNSAGLVGGAIYRATNTGSVNLQSTIVAGNQANIGPDLFFDVPTLITADNSLIGIADSGNLSVTGIGNLLGTKAAPLDAKLGPLANNGGLTMTHALLPGSPAINAGNNANKLTTDQRGTGFARVVGGQADIGAFEVQSPPPRVLAVQVNDGSAQRSMITSFKVTFSEPVIFPNGITAALELRRTGPGTPTGLVNIDAVQTGNDVLVTFAGGGAVQLDPGNSLKDGKYWLTLRPDRIIGIGGQLDGDSDGTAGDVYVFETHRLFGDANGDGIVSAVDFNAFRLAYGSMGASIFDFDGDNQVSASDFNQFRLRYGVVL